MTTIISEFEADITPTLTYDIGVDIDDVLYPWYTTAHYLCIDAGITNGVDPKTWRMHEEYGCDKQDWIDVLERATDIGVLYAMPPIPGSIEALRRLMFAGHRIHLVTARGTAGWQTIQQRVDIRRQSRKWAEEYAVPADSLTFDSDKASVARRKGLDYFIDDGVHNFQDLELGAPNCQTYLMTAPHNGDFYTPFRLETMDEFAELVIEAGEKGALT